MHGKCGYELVRLVNGAYSVKSIAHGETFHPVIGPTAEAEALYLKQLNLVDRIAHHEGEFVIWDVGFGAAANVLTVLHNTRQVRSQIRVLSFDCTLEPAQFALTHSQQLGYFRDYEAAVRSLVDFPEKPVEFRRDHQCVSWELHLGDFPTLLQAPQARHFPKPHAILFDAYSPATNPGMWTQSLFSSLFGLLNPMRPCALPTYSRSTLLRVTLLLAGFFVGRGHATGEKEETTIAANARELLRDMLDLRWLRRVRNSTSAQPLSEPVYRQSPLTEETWRRLTQHPQFAADFAGSGERNL